VGAGVRETASCSLLSRRSATAGHVCASEAPAS